MKPKELIASLRAYGPQSLSVILHFLADHLYQARLDNGLSRGMTISDAIDFKTWLEQLAEAAEDSSSPVSNHCPSCGHVHLGEKECGEDMGGAGTCQCSVEVHI